MGRGMPIPGPPPGLAGPGKGVGMMPPPPSMPPPPMAPPQKQVSSLRPGPPGL